MKIKKYIVGIKYPNDYFTAYFQTNSEVEKFTNSFKNKKDAYVIYIGKIYDNKGDTK